MHAKFVAVSPSVVDVVTKDEEERKEWLTQMTPFFNGFNQETWTASEVERLVNLGESLMYGGIAKILSQKEALPSVTLQTLLTETEFIALAYGNLPESLLVYRHAHTILFRYLEDTAKILLMVKSLKLSSAATEEKSLARTLSGLVEKEMMQKEVMIARTYFEARHLVEQCIEKLLDTVTNGFVRKWQSAQDMAYIPDNPLSTALLQGLVNGVLWEAFSPGSADLVLKAGQIHTSATKIGSWQVTAAWTAGIKGTPMEDSHCVIERLGGREDVSLVIVCDGHGSDWAAQYVIDKLPRYLAKSVTSGSSFSDVQEIFEEACEMVSQQINTLILGRQKPFSGAVAVAMLRQKDCVTVMSVGDCRAVLNHDGLGLQVSMEHKAVYRRELERVERKFSDKLLYLVEGGPQQRTYPVIRTLTMGPSRSFGDGNDSVLIPKPEFCRFVPSKEDQFLILASDGVWDVISNQELVNMIGDLKKPGIGDEDCLKRMLQEAVRRDSDDNITIVMVRF